MTTQPNIENLRERLAAHLLGENATLNAIHRHIRRLKADDPAIGWSVEGGQHRLVRTVYDNSGKSTVTSLTDRMSADALLGVVERM